MIRFLKGQEHRRYCNSWCSKHANQQVIRTRKTMCIGRIMDNFNMWSGEGSKFLITWTKNAISILPPEYFDELLYDQPLGNHQRRPDLVSVPVTTHSAVNL